ncbi:nucleotidyltransferase domain-containing protein [Chryseobacterium scophthalmum]|uniref:nucleotidyltransferase domain-containing protein n=1 Tax=Chryseobacterium scophthalmum TaxID=59733 RepID=UPI00398A9DCC
MENTLNSLISSLKLLSNNKCYLFGSIIDENRNLKNDIDILILYKNENEPKIIREKLDQILILFPIHIIFLTYEEEDELNFIQRVNAVLI